MDNLQCQRHLMILGLLGFAVLYILRVNLSVAIVAMVGTEQKKKDETIFRESCPVNKKDGIKEPIFEGEINWDEKACGEALASFFYGYVLTNFAGGRLADRFGGKRVYGFGVFLTSLLAFLLPSAARNSKECFNIIRLLQGMTEAKHVPWVSVFTSLPFLATVVVHFGSNFGFYFLLTELPTYLSTVHHFNMKNNGLISSLPYLFMWLFSISYGSFIHYLTTKTVMPIHIARTISNAIGMYLPMSLLVCISYAGCNSAVAVSIICLAVSLSAATQCGFLCSFQDLAPNYAGTLTGISNTVASIPGFLAPVITSYIIEGQPTIEQWTKIFMIASFIYFVTGTFNLIFMSSEVQPWNSYSRFGSSSERLVKNI